MKKVKTYFLKREHDRAEWLVLLLYLVLLLLVSTFHEFHFDELQAWNIARSASLHDILFTVPHYEGHPQLWHLLLYVFARCGIPLDISLRFWTTGFSLGTAALLLFRSPFPRWIRWILPFTYYFCYQYGVVCRPYSMMMFAFMLCAATYTARNAHPWRYVLSMILLCMTSAFGIMVAGGLCIAWTFEIIRELRLPHGLPDFLKSAKFRSLLTILICAVFLIISITPAEDCYYNGLSDTTPAFQRLISPYYWKNMLIMHFDAWFGAVLSYDTWNVSTPAIALEILGSVLMLCLLTPFLYRNHKLLLWMLPHFMVNGFMAFHYFSVHHLGVLVLIDVFTFWTVFAQPEGVQFPESYQRILHGMKSPLIKRCLLGSAVVFGMIPVVYTVSAGVKDISYLYAPGSTFAAFIKDNHLENAKLMAAWDTMYKGADGKISKSPGAFRLTNYIPSDHDEIVEQRTYQTGTTSAVGAYFDKPIFLYSNVLCHNDLYMHYKWHEDSEEIFSIWRSYGPPDFVFEYASLEDVFDEVSLDDVYYVCIYEFQTNYIYKINDEEGTHRVFIRADLLDQYPQFHQLYPYP